MAPGDEVALVDVLGLERLGDAAERVRQRLVAELGVEDRHVGRQ
jgi:hypothetical protein